MRYTIHTICMLLIAVGFTWGVLHYAKAQYRYGQAAGHAAGYQEGVHDGIASASAPGPAQPVGVVVCGRNGKPSAWKLAPGDREPMCDSFDREVCPNGWVSMYHEMYPGEHKAAWIVNGLCLTHP